MATGSQFNEKTIKKLLVYLAKGHTREAAARLVGMSDRTIRDWVAKAAAGSEEHQAFVVRLEMAEALGIDEAIEAIRSAFGEWRAAAWFLAMKDPEHWGDKAKRTAREAIEEILKIVEDVLGRASAERVYKALADRHGSKASREDPEGIGQSGSVH